MSDEPENSVLVFLRRLDTKLDIIREDITDLKQRMTTVELQVSHLAAVGASHYASLAGRLDRLENRLDRVERRLDMVNAA